MMEAPSCADALRARLAAGTPTCLMAIRAWPLAEAVHAAATSGHHGVYIDMQHGAITLERAANLCLVAAALQLPALVRLPAFDHALIGAVLDHGATGILVPDVEDLRTAWNAVAASRHPPAGRRSIAARRGFATEPRPFVAPMLETPRGVGVAAEIAALAGVDALVVGSGDLAAHLSDPGQLEAQLAAVLAAGRRHGCPVVVAGLRDAGAARRAVDAGAACCFITGTDIAYLMAGAQRQLAAFGDVFADPVRGAEGRAGAGAP